MGHVNATQPPSRGSAFPRRMTRTSLVAGGGAAGYFAAIRAAEMGADVTLLEATGTPLQKVRISGGGRCNVTHACFEPEKLVENYPRGAKELRGVFARFQPRDTVRWFEERGVPLKTEPDGRMFPTTDDSETIVACLVREAEKAGVHVRTHARPQRLLPAGDRWLVALRDGSTVEVDRVLLATGSNPEGHALARAAGHTVVPPVPALFSFVVPDPRIEGLAGVSVPRVRASLEVAGLKRPVVREGALLVTHQGLSAYAVLRTSSWAARELAEAKYHATLMVDLVPDATEEDLRRGADDQRRHHPTGRIGTHGFAPGVPRRLWERLVAAAGVDPDTIWTEVPRAGLNKLVSELKRGRYAVAGKGDFREEIVTCGGVSRKEVDWTTMESRVAPGLHFAGEILDVDGLTGGFNFQNAWSTGWIAGTAMARGGGSREPEVRVPPAS